MRIRKSVIASTSMVLLVAGLASCSLFKPDGKPLPTKDCTRPGLCEVDVVVRDCSPTTNERILVDKAGGPIEIRWNAPAGYAFTREGINFEGTSPVIDPKPGPQERGTRWTVVDRPNGQKVVVKYRIQLQSISTPSTVCTGPDPFIANE